jgi:hypothetical protein
MHGLLLVGKVTRAIITTHCKMMYSGLTIRDFRPMLIIIIGFKKLSSSNLGRLAKK